MITKRQIKMAVFISIALHILFAVGMTSILAYKRAMPPLNDDFGRAINIESKKYYSSLISTKYFSREENEPVHSGRGEGGSVWWKWTAPNDCEVLLDVVSSGFEHVCDVYTGALLETLTKVPASNDNHESKLQFQASENTTYHFVIASTLPSASGSTEIKMSVMENNEDYTIILPEMLEVEEVEETKVEKEFARTDSNEPSPIKPLSANLESDKNTLAASDLMPSKEGDEGVPNISGEDLSFGELSTKDYSDGEDEGAPSLPILPQWLPDQGEISEVNKLKEVTEEAAENFEKNNEISGVEETESSNFPVEDESLADIKIKDTELNQKEIDLIKSLEEVGVNSSVSDTVKKTADPNQAEKIKREPFPPDSSFQAETVKKRTEGKLSNLGKAALNVEETDLGHFKKKVDLAIQKSWHRARSAHADLVKYGSLKVRFWINEEGQIVDIRLLRNDADPVVVDFSISGILRAEIPPVPKELIEKTQDGKMEFEYEIIIY